MEQVAEIAIGQLCVYISGVNRSWYQRVQDGKTTGTAQELIDFFAPKTDLR